MNDVLVFSPPRYTGRFVTLYYLNEGWGWQVTNWEYGKPGQHWYYISFISALLFIVKSGFNWANPKMQNVFENDVILAGE